MGSCFSFLTKKKEAETIDAGCHGFANPSYGISNGSVVDFDYDQADEEVLYQEMPNSSYNWHEPIYDHPMYTSKY